MAEEPVQPDPVRNRRRARRWGAALLVGVALVATTAWWFAGRRVWTDDATIRRAAAAAELREVLWARPQPLGDAFNTGGHEYEPSVSPDGSEVYFVRGKPSQNADVYVSRRGETGDGGVAWSEPEALASINTEGDELGPRLTLDGRFLLFYSDRAGGVGQFDVWAAPRLAGPGGGGFGEPFNLGPAVNSELNEYGPAPTPDGRGLLFASNRKSARSEQREAWRATIRQSDSGDYDVFLATLETSSVTGDPPSVLPPVRGQRASAPATTLPTSQPAMLPTSQPVTRPADPDAAPALVYQPAHEVRGVNTPHHEGASCVSPAGDFLYFTSDRPGGAGKFDLYRGRLKHGVVTAIENLGPAINTPDNETDPQIVAGGFHLLFSSDGESSRGGYDLLAAESREVYARRDARPLPAVGGRSMWLLLIALAALLPLLYFLRGWDDHRLNLLQKCLLVSVLFHVVLTILFSLYHVSRDVVQYVQKQQEMELAVDLRGPDVEAMIAADIRGQSRLALPVQAPPPAEVAQTPTVAEELPLETLEPLDAGDLAVPQAGVDPGRMVVEVPVRRVELPGGGETLELTPPAPPASQLPEITLAPPQAPVAAPEGQPPAANVQETALARMAVAAPGTGAPEEVAVEVRPTEIDVESLVQAAEPERTASPADAERVVTEQPRPTAAVPDVTATVPAGAPVAGAEATVPEPGDVAVGLERQGVEVAMDGPGAVSPEVPVAELAAARESLAAAPEMRRATVPGPDGLPVPVNVAATADRVDVELKATMEKVAARPAGDAAGPAQPALPNAGRLEPGDATAMAARDVAVGAEPARPDVSPSDLESLAGSTTRPSVVESAEVPVSPETVPPGSIATEIAAAAGRSMKAGGDAEAELASAEQKLGQEKLAPAAGPAAGGAATVETDVPAAGAASKPEQSLAGGAGTGPRMLAEASVAPEPAAIDAPEVSLPGAGESGPKIASADRPGPAAPDRDNALMLSVRTDVPGEASGPANLSIDPSKDPAAMKPAEPGDALASAAAIRPRAEAVDVSVGPQLSVTLPDLTAPEAMFQRSAEMRKPLVEKMGGTKQSEESVDRGLAYLARQQEPDGRWTRVDDDGPPGKRGKGPHDMACTGLSALAFLAADHTPAKPGPYRDVVEKALDFLVANQGPDGDLRGYPERRGGGSGAANMYDHGIACLALGEAGIMTGDKRYIDAALRGAAFTVASQHSGTGGWRYVPQEPGDTSVFGWQVMALHSAEQLGFEMPAATREGVERYVKIASTGPRKMLGGYTPGSGPTPAMTAELLFARVLLGHEFDEGEVKEASDYLAQHAPQPGGDVYGWYYASLSLIQMENEAWRTWNERCRETLVTTQRTGGPSDGSWDTNLKWGDHAGRIYTTAMATLTLEVYYRYLPMVQKK